MRFGKFEFDFVEKRLNARLVRDIGRLSNYRNGLGYFGNVLSRKSKSFSFASSKHDPSGTGFSPCSCDCLDFIRPDASWKGVRHRERGRYRAYASASTCDDDDLSVGGKC